MGQSLYSNKIYAYQNLYGNKVYTNIIYTVTKFIHNKIYTNIICTETKLIHVVFLIPLSLIRIKSSKNVYISTCKYTM
jgi:hypothetical protein